MSHLDQCPSSKKEGKPAASEVTRTARDVSRATGRAYWRSLDDLASTKSFQDFLHREFPAYASELLSGSRRAFLKLMGASMALAGAATIPGCRQPDHKILAYNKDPEHVIPGKPLYYATAMPLPGGGGEGLLAETFEGRPTKLEGNPLHAYNRGKSSAWAQASVLALYDPDRDPEVIADQSKRAGQEIKVGSWDAFAREVKSAFSVHDASKGAKLAFLVEKATSPSRDDLRERILKRWPAARWFAAEAMDNESAIEGSKLAFGGVYRESLKLENASVIVSLDKDFMHGEDATLPVARGYAASRFRKGADGKPAAGTSMSRLYVVEATMSPTGGAADHRWRMKASRIPGFAVRLAQAVLAKTGGAALQSAIAAAASACIGDDYPKEGGKEVIEHVAADLLDPKNRGKSVIMAGASQPAAVHALCHALNAALGNVGSTIQYVEVKGDAAQSSAASMASLVKEIDAGSIDTLVIVGGNPVFAATGDINLKARLAKVANTIYLGEADETAASVKTYLARAHFLEAWGDVTTWEGEYSVVQPMTKPLFGGHSELELLGTILGDGVTDGYDIVRRTVTAKAGANAEKVWRKTLHDGVLAGSQAAYAKPAINEASVAQSIARIPGIFKQGASTEVELIFAPSPHIHDGRWANNGWLQELPHPVTKLVWDNLALISKGLADKLGVTTDRHPDDAKYSKAEVITLTVGDKKLNIAAWVQPGLADDTVVLHTGYGRELGGRVAMGTGFNVYPLRRSTEPGRVMFGVKAEKATDADLYPVACTQDHWTIEGRDILREVDLAAWHKFGDADIANDKHIQIDPYDNSRNVNFAGRLGTEGHAPAGIDIYKKGPASGMSHNLRGGAQYLAQVDENGNVKRDEKGRVLAPLNKYGKRIQQWGMSIDMTTCTGCSACVIACQAENNIPIVGKIEASKGREMHWIRVDRYYASDPKEPFANADNPDMVFQPVACVHCENAPCEVVCPVNATTHDTAGTNNMAYNRCIGTKYCSNNCPYKVRRFNWFDYGTKQYKGSWGQVGTPLKELGAPMIANPNLIPPRLREKNAEVANMQKNPHVTVRSRGVMEKCTYCIQRVNFASVETKLHDLKYIPDGFVQTACQQACPTSAIVFGDIYDYESNDGKGSEVSNLRTDPRSYGLLAFVNTRPRTTHMIRVRNPNPAIRRPVDDPFIHHGHDSHDEGGHETHGTEGHEPKPAGHVMSLPVLSNARAGALA